MSENKHTPGPWTIAGRATALEVVEARRSWMSVCFLTSDGPCEANARLIAAAPDLLAALNAMLNYYKTEGCADPTCNICKRSKAAEDAARVAIAKAEGRS